MTRSEWRACTLGEFVRLQLPHNTCLYVTDFLGNHPRFAYYLLQTLDLAGCNSGSAQPSLNRSYIHGMPLRVPEPDEQRRIAEVLRAFDDRIDLLRQTNTTLESIAQALFKSCGLTAAVAEAFERIATLLRGQMECNVERAENLTELRDTLLPRLISGRLRLPEARDVDARIEAGP